MKQRIFKNKSEFILIFFFSLFLSVLLLSDHVNAAMPQFNDDEAVYICEENSGSVLTSQNENKKIYPASTTKLMTTLVALDYVGDKMDDKVTIGDEIKLADSDSSLADLEEGEVYPWREMFYALLVPSGNDAALTIAVNVARIETGNNTLDNDTAIREFVSLMNKKATDMGLSGTHFTNPHGLQDGDHYTTAGDLYKIAEKVMENTTIQSVVKTPVYSVKTSNNQTKKWLNTNYLLYDSTSASQATDYFSGGVNPYYNKLALGIKTGHTDEAGRCLVFSSQDGDKKLLGVIMNADSPDTLFGQADNAINALSSDYQRITWTDDSGKVEDIKVKGTHLFDGRKLTVQTGGTASSMVLNSDKDSYSKDVALNSDFFEKINDSTYKIKASVSEGQQIGTLNINKNGQTVQQIAVYSNKKMRTRNFIDFIILLVVIGLIILICFYIYAKRIAKQRRMERMSARNRKRRRR